MNVLAVDLAAKYSAACLMDDNYQVLEQFDSWLITETQFIRGLVTECRFPSVPDVIVIEDLPHGLNYSTLVKTVCRLQGRIYEALRDSAAYENVMFLSPAEWRRTYPGMKNGTGPGVVTEVAARYGYAAPDLSERAKVKGGRAIARKVATDYCSAYLIARWAVSVHAEFGTYDMVGTSRYDTKVIRKSDFAAEGGTGAEDD